MAVCLRGFARWQHCRDTSANGRCKHGLQHFFNRNIALVAELKEVRTEGGPVQLAVFVVADVEREIADVIYSVVIRVLQIHTVCRAQQGVVFVLAQPDVEVA